MKNGLRMVEQSQKSQTMTDHPLRFVHGLLFALAIEALPVIAIWIVL